MADKRLPKIVKIKDREALHYDSCGLGNIYILSGYEIKENGSYSIIALDALHHCIAMTLINESSRLTGKEMRFLRKELSMTQRDLAGMINSDVQSVARWEKDSVEHGAVNIADRLLRVIYLSHTGKTEQVEKLLGKLAELDPQPEKTFYFKKKEGNVEDWEFSDYSVQKAA